MAPHRAGSPGSLFWFAAPAIAVAAVGIGACSSSSSGANDQGTERGPCYPNGSCNAGLICLSDTCVMPPDADSGADVTDTGADGSVPNDSGQDVAIDVARADGSDASASPDADASGGAQRGCPADAGSACFTVYAHTSTDLYYLDLTSTSLGPVLVPIGPFAAQLADGGADPITDLAVGPDDTIWLISHAALYRADPMTGRAQLVGPIAACGNGSVAMTADLTGMLYVGDSSGTLCKLDPTTTPPTVSPIGQMSGGFALAGDLAVVGTTAYGTIYTLASPGTVDDDRFATIDLTSAQTTAAANATGFPRLYGLAYGLHEAIAFTGDGSGRVVTIDPASGTGTPFATFVSDAGQSLGFAGAGVNPRVAP